MDDGCLGGHPQTVINDLQKIKETYNSHGLQLNTAKCELFLVDSLYDEEDLNGRSSTSSSSNRRSSGFDSSAKYSNFWSFPNSLDSSSLGSNIWSFPSASNEDIVKQFNDLYNGIRVTEKSKLSLLGAPIFTSAVQSVLKPKIENLKLMVSRLKQIDSHEALFLLSHCFGIPKLIYFLRSSPCFMSPEILEEFDTVIKDSVVDILNISLSEFSYV